MIFTPILFSSEARARSAHEGGSSSARERHSRLRLTPRAWATEIASACSAADIRTETMRVRRFEELAVASWEVCLMAHLYQGPGAAPRQARREGVARPELPEPNAERMAEGIACYSPDLLVLMVSHEPHYSPDLLVPTRPICWF